MYVRRTYPTRARRRFLVGELSDTQAAGACETRRIRVHQALLHLLP